ncbi:MAG: hypothetical protein ACFWUM_01965 [Eubacteriales bacterium]|jgi:hypothetical protein
MRSKIIYHEFGKYLCYFYMGRQFTNNINKKFIHNVSAVISDLDTILK